MSDQAYDFSLPHRQNKLGILVYLIRNFRGLLSLFFALIAISASNPGFWVYLPFILIPVAILGSVLAYLQFRNFTFRIQGDEVIIQKGVFIKETVRIPIDRIQSIQVSEHVVQRILGLVAIRLDTAGSKGNELEIPALNRQLATVLKDYLYQRKAAQDVEDESEFIESIPTVNEEKTLLRLTPIDLLKVGLTENHLRTGIIALAFIFGTFSQYQEYITERFGNEVDVYTDQVVSMGFQIIIFLIVLFAISSIFISTIKVILQFYDLKVVLNAETIDRIFRKMGDQARVELKSYAKEITSKHPGIKIYVGSDSQNYATKTLYATTIVFRFENNGAHVIYHKEATPLVRDMWTRLWGELQRSIDVAGYLRFECDIQVWQIDLDLNSDPDFPSNKVFQAAVGYAQSMGYQAKTKPDLLLATWAANILVN